MGNKPRRGRIPAKKKQLTAEGVLRKKETSFVQSHVGAVGRSRKKKITEWNARKKGSIRAHDGRRNTMKIRPGAFRRCEEVGVRTDGRVFS